MKASERSICSGDWRFKIAHFPYDEMTETIRNFVSFRRERQTRYFVSNKNPKPVFPFRFERVKKPIFRFTKHFVSNNPNPLQGRSQTKILVGAKTFLM